MTLHGFKEYLKYKWRAKGRHGIHSPFVYAFIENVIQDRNRITITSPVEFPGIPAYDTKLVNRLLQHYDYRVILIPGQDGETDAIPDALMLSGDNPGLWDAGAGKYFQLLKKDSVVFVIGVHRTVQHSKAWALLCARKEVLMSIDLYGMGVLFFKKEFKEKQLRY